MGEFAGFFSEIWDDFLEQSPANQLAIAITLASVTVLPLFGWVRSLLRIGNRETYIEGLEARKADLEVKLAAAEKTARIESEFASKWMPQRWLEQAEKERRDGKEESAIRHLRVGYDNVASDLSQVTGQLAEAYASLLAESPGHLKEAQHFARLTHNLRPGDREAAAFLGHLLEIAPSDQGGSREEVADLLSLPRDPNAAAGLINAILTRGQQLHAEGHYRTCVVLCRRAVLAAERSGLYDQAIGLTARFYHAKALESAGHSDTALELVQTLLPMHEHVKGAQHSDVLATRDLEARILYEIGDAATALEKVQALLPIRERVQGAEHPDVLVTRFAEAQILNGTGDAGTALEKVQALLPIRERVQGAEHPDVLQTKYLLATILDALGRHDEAKDLANTILPLQIEKRGPEHKDVKDTQALLDRLNDGAGD